ncbi:biotin synthase BioB [Heliorestis acidaminivorans]|uniref:Biotin synthase n=1 Tax=Heliorestis acidaminivorans TaxID=553427 RepID=A0A6I0F1A7_9FIRM|nr:biotin synthase BioB [Heliorestis acidaminivorans]KAB2952124.1 biotin synthase BioB [Heliorestis acidaminivorans]
MSQLFQHIKEKLEQGELITFEEALALSQAEINNEELFALANKVRQQNKGDHVDLCTIINAKSGKCAENCKYCAQSVHYNTNVQEYPLISMEKVIAEAKENEKAGVHRFSIVTSGGSLSKQDFEKVLEMIKALRSETNLLLCASLGSISYEQALQLKTAGITSYHHNIETCRDFYKNICDSHSYDDRIDTIQNALKAGLDVCCGGIIGMGETMEDRLKMAFELRELAVQSIPINILNPIKGTPLENMPILSPEEILKTIALFRLVIPYSTIRYAGGRSALGEEQKKGFQAGVNAALVGNFLTTLGKSIDEDIKMIKDAGLEV